MPNENILPKELVEIAISLERQFQELGLPNRKIPLTEWNSVPEKVKSLIPQWLITLLSNHSLTGPILERRDEIYKWNRYFAFWPPNYYTERVSFEDSIMTENYDAGFIPISDANNGDLWLIKIKNDPLSPVYLFDLSDWERKLASDNFLHFLASCKVSKEQ